MVEEQVEIVIVAIVVAVIFGFWLKLCHMIYLAYCRKNCGHETWKTKFERTQSMFYVTEEAAETSETDQEHQLLARQIRRRSSVVFLTNDSNIM
jgi:hypothetical protein